MKYNESFRHECLYMKEYLSKFYKIWGFKYLEDSSLSI